MNSKHPSAYVRLVAPGLALGLFLALSAAPRAAQAGPLATAPVQVAGHPASEAYEGRVEAVRQTVIAAQVAGAVEALPVHAGERVQAGQVLVRLDARAADQQANAAAAQVQAARAAQEAATREFERQQTLFNKSYISRAALDRAEADYKAAQAQASAQLAAAGAARSQTRWFTATAPYAGVVSELPVVLGDMAMPGRPLVTVYDPHALRVSARLPQSVAQRLQAGTPVQVEVPGVLPQPIATSHWELLPAVDPASHTRELRVNLPPDTAVPPGAFARAWLAGVSEGAAAEATRLTVPTRAVLRRAELVGVYVVDAQGQALLRQVRLGRADGDRVEVLSGLAAGERVALDPQAAAAGR